ncbi:hypothetical protein NDU88_002855 [Pleurodeles waltl]|uniref:Uncharacterized protein n=1 Tax=Pleurodeles waltl TaxID=8319 RepID=A0AAV7QDW7_PLEWA|nr:hypothetical protein NDU88_002855 [Pleurodeles waltl]
MRGPACQNRVESQSRPQSCRTRRAGPTEEQAQKDRWDAVEMVAYFEGAVGDPERMCSEELLGSSNLEPYSDYMMHSTSETDLPQVTPQVANHPG